MWNKRNSKGNNCCECNRKIPLTGQEWICIVRDGNINPITGKKYYELTYCLDCGEEEKLKSEEKEISKARNLISDCLKELVLIRAKETNPNSFTMADYQKIKSWKEKISKLPKQTFTNDPFLKTQFEISQTSLQELEQLVPERIKSAYQVKSPNPNKRKAKIKQPQKTCSHSDIVSEEDNLYYWYCDNCGEDTDIKFIKALQKDIIKDIYKNCQKYNINPLFDFKNSAQQLTDLRAEKFATQTEVKKAFQPVEKELKEVLNGKGINIKDIRDINNDNNNPPPRKNQEQLQQDITNLTNKPNKTPQEEAELKDKQAQLAQLTKPTNTEPTNNNNSWLTPALLIAGGIIVVLAIIWLIVNYNNRKK